MNDITDRHIALSGAYNIRDLGGYHTGEGATTQTGRVLRADSPHRLTDEDIDTLLAKGLRTVIDLRAPHEIVQAPTRLSGLSDLHSLHLPLFDALAPDSIYRGVTAPQDDPLQAFYARTLETRQAALRDVFQAIAEAPPGAVMFHCTAGKDRTGLVSALLLGVAGVTEDDIVSDYVLTRALIADLVAEFLDLARERGTDIAAYRRVLACKPETMQAVLRHLHETYGTASDYLAGAGLDAGHIRGLSRRMLEPD